ncbi:MAG: hypothetical protein ACYC1D_08350 [Acidimicrobiales bacterium]
MTDLGAPGDPGAPGAPVADVPEEAARRLGGPAFSSGLSVRDFAACLHSGMRPVGLVQGFCVMRWSWYGASSAMLGGGRYQGFGRVINSYACPHGYMSADHRSWGQNFEQPQMTAAWREGYASAYARLMEEAADAGAHGVVGVVDRVSQMIDSSIREFHLMGTAVVLEGAAPPAMPWSTYLAGQRMGKLIEAGFMPVSVVASSVSVRVWEVCSTEILLNGSYDGYGLVRPGQEIVQLADAQMAARRLARDQIKSSLGSDALHGARMDVAEHEIAAGDREVTCTLRGTRVHRFADAAPLAAPRPTVRLS